MSDEGRRWYRSLYWRIALGYVALLALLLLVQTSLAVWMMGNVWGRANRTPAQFADMVAQDLSAQLAQNPGVDLNAYLRGKYRRGYQPFAVVLQTREETFSNRATAIPPNLARDARRMLFSAMSGESERERFGRGGRGRRPFAEYSEITVKGSVEGMVAVPATGSRRRG